MNGHIIRACGGPRSTAAGAAHVRLSQQTGFGKHATQDLTRTLDAIDVGILHINSESAGADPHVPFGGAKKSGYGPKEQGRSAREFFTHTTMVYLRGGQATI